MEHFWLVRGKMGRPVRNIIQFAEIGNPVVMVPPPPRVGRITHSLILTHLGQQILCQVHLDEVGEAVERRPVHALQAHRGRRQPLQVHQVEAGELPRGEHRDGVA